MAATADVEEMMTEDGVAFVAVVVVDFLLGSVAVEAAAVLLLLLVAANGVIAEDVFCEEVLKLDKIKSFSMSIWNGYLDARRRTQSLNPSSRLDAQVW